MLVIQSYREQNVPAWIAKCMESVQQWSHLSSFDYHCAGDEELLSLLPETFRAKLQGKWPMLADLGRLKLMQKALATGEQRVLWLDADVFVAKPTAFEIPKKLNQGYAFGREQWIEASGKVRNGVHNAICAFERENPFLEYYIHACESIVDVHKGEQFAPQLLGPKFLKMQHSLLNFDLLDSVAMLSPDVADSLINGDGKLWQKQVNLAQGEITAVNLCSSLIDDHLAEAVIEKIS